MNSLDNNHTESTFYIIPRYIRRLPGLTLAFLDIYELIFQLWNQDKDCWFGIEKICQRTGHKKSIVYKAIVFFEEHNEIKRIRLNGKQYFIKPEKKIEIDLPIDHDISTNMEKKFHKRGKTVSTNVEHRINNKSSINNINKTLVDFDKSTSYREDKLFMEFYNSYPQKQKPSVAYKAFLRHKPTPEFVGMLIADIQTRIKKNWCGRPKDKIPFPATYLNSCEWEGETYEIDNRPAKLNTRYTMDELLGDYL